MDFIRIRDLQKHGLTKLGQAGQSTVEYILLFAVITSIAATIFKSQKFNELFGNNGVVATTYKQRVEFSYRHGFIKSEAIGGTNYRDGNHKSYKGRFFSAKDGYPAR